MTVALSALTTTFYTFNVSHRSAPLRSAPSYSRNTTLFTPHEKCGLTCADFLETHSRWTAPRADLTHCGYAIRKETTAIRLRHYGS